MRILVASSNPGKLREYQAMASTLAADAPAPASGEPLDFNLLPNFVSLPAFEESAPTFAENAAGKALHYSRFASDAVIADDSGLAVPALGGAPGVNSARYAGAQASDADRVRKLLAELRAAGAFRESTGGHRGPPLPMDLQVGADPRACPGPAARFVCVLALARQGKVLAVFSDFVEGALLDAPRGSGGFGYDPLFLYPPLGKTFAEIPRDEKNRLSHRGKAFRKLVSYSRAQAALLA